jgi:TubC N-terminal docking domain
VTPAALVTHLQARGVTLEPRGDRLRVRPVGLVTPAEVEALKRHKAEVLALLAEASRPRPAAPPSLMTLDPTTVREFLGDHPDPHDLAMLRVDVAEAVARLEAGIRAGHIPTRQLVRGRPLADWLDLAEVARLLRLGAEDRP